MMKPISLIFTTASLAMATLAIASDSAMLHFLNGDSLPGRLQTLDREQITWNSPALKMPTEFFTEKIRDLRLLPQIHNPEAASSHEATLTLMNGDTVRGQLASVVNHQIILDTWYAGRLVFRRAMVRDLTIREMPEYLYRGPLTLDTWTQSEEPPRWSMDHTGALTSTSSGGIAKDIPLPDEFTLDFEAQWQGSFRLHLVLFSDNPASDSPENGYEVVFQRQSVHIRRCGQRQWLGHSNRAIALQQNEKARIRIRASNRTGQFALYVNDRIIDAWTDAEIDAASLGTALHFLSRDNSPLTISRIDVSRWDGILEELPAERPMIAQFGFGGGGIDMRDLENEALEAAEAENDGSMVLKNGDRVRGTVKAIEDGIITIETPYREIALPVERLRTLALMPVDLEEPKRENGDVRAWFSDGGSIVFRLEGVTDDGSAVQGYSQTFGNAVFDLSAFNRLEFNIYDLFREEL